MVLRVRRGGAAGPRFRALGLRNHARVRSPHRLASKAGLRDLGNSQSHLGTGRQARGGVPGEACSSLAFTDNSASRTESRTLVLAVGRRLRSEHLGAENLDVDDRPCAHEPTPAGPRGEGQRLAMVERRMVRRYSNVWSGSRPSASGMGTSRLKVAGHSAPVTNRAIRPGAFCPSHASQWVAAVERSDTTDDARATPSSQPPEVTSQTIVQASSKLSRGERGRSLVASP